MHDYEDLAIPVAKRVPWNKGKLIGARPPLRQKHVWAIRTRLQIEQRVRDLALFNLAIDSKLRGCDVVAVRVDDVAPGGQAIERATVRQRKTGQPVRFEITEQTRQAINEIPNGFGQEAGRLSVQRARCPAKPDHPAIRTPVVGVADRDRARPVRLRYALAAADQGNLDLSPHGDSTGFSFCLDIRRLRAPRYLGIDIDDALTISEQIDI